MKVFNYVTLKNPINEDFADKRGIVLKVKKEFVTVMWLYAGGFDYREEIDADRLRVIPQPQGFLDDSVAIHIIYSVHDQFQGSFAFPVAWALFEQELDLKMKALCRLNGDNRYYISILNREVSDLSYVINIDASDIPARNFIGFEYSTDIDFLPVVVGKMIEKTGLDAFCSGFSNRFVNLRIRDTLWEMPLTAILSVMASKMDVVAEGYFSVEQITSRKTIHQFASYQTIVEDIGDKNPHIPTIYELDEITDTTILKYPQRS